MKTELIKAEHDNIREAAERAAWFLNRDRIVAIPTETVYGLAASIYSEDALREVYRVKGRPQDNPVIVHISSMEMLDGLVAEIPQEASLLAERFWPGPLTMIFRKTERISDTITCGMDTVAIRYPSHPVANAVRGTAGCTVGEPFGKTVTHDCRPLCP